MNDSHLDPPDYPEPPEWYCEIESILDEQPVPKDVATVIRTALEDWCNWCNEQRHPDPEPDPVVELPDDYFPGPDKCPHEKPWGDCDACNYASDIAYDAAREARFSR